MGDLIHLIYLLTYSIINIYIIMGTQICVLYFRLLLYLLLKLFELWPLGALLVDPLIYFCQSRCFVFVCSEFFFFYILAVLEVPDLQVHLVYFLHQYKRQESSIETLFWFVQLGFFCCFLFFLLQLKNGMRNKDMGTRYPHSYQGFVSRANQLMEQINVCVYDSLFTICINISIFNSIYIHIYILTKHEFLLISPTLIH